MKVKLEGKHRKNMQESLAFSETLDGVLAKLGVAKTTALLARILKGPACSEEALKARKSLTAFTINRCAELYGLDPSKLKDSEVPEYREGRMACYQAIRMATNYSYSKIAESFGRSERHVKYYCAKAREELQLAKMLKRPWARQYDKLEDNVLDYHITWKP